MAYDLAELRERVRNRLDDEDFEQEYLDRTINYAQWQITNKHKLTFLEKSASLTLNPGEHSISLPADFHEYQHLLVIDPINVRSNLTDEFMNYNDFINTYIDPSVNQQNPPYRWSEYGRAIRFSAPADQEYTLRLDYQRKSPALVNENAVPDIPEEFAELLEIGAYMRIAKREDDYEVKTFEQRDYDQLLLDLLRVYGRKKGPGGIRRMRVR